MHIKKIKFKKLGSKSPNLKGLLEPKIKKKKLLFSLFLVLLILLPIYFIFFHKQAQASWWDEIWHYRKSIPLTNSSGSAQTDFQIKILDNYDLSADITASKIQSDLDDLRFTTINGEVLDYWIEDNTNNSVDVWIKIPSLLAGNSVIYMYYGNPQALAYSDGNKVFDFFDDFNDNAVDSNKWAMENFGSGGSSTETSGELQLISTNSQTGSANAKTLKNFTNNVVIEWKRFDTEEHYNDLSFGYGNVVAEDGSSAYWHTTAQYGYFNKIQDSINFIYNRITNGFASNMQADIDGPDAGQWIKYKNVYSSAGLWQWSYDTGAGYNLLGTGQTDATYLNNEKYILLSRGSYSGTTSGGTSKIDYIFVRKYTATQPTAGTFGTEEKSPAPVGYWSFDEGYGTVAHDESSNKNNGTITGATWKNESECVSGKCLYFNGADLTKADADIPDNPSKVSACAWIKPNALTNEDNDTSMYIFGKSWFVEMQNDGQVQFQISTSNSYPNITTTDSIEINKWSYVCATYDGLGTVPKIYINGSEKNGTGAVGSGTLTDDSSVFLRIGAKGDNDYSYNFNGYIDEPKIYDYARSADQIKADFAAGSAGQGKIFEGASATFGSKSESWLTDGLVGYWKMDESSWNGTTGEVKDASGNNNHGVRSGTASTTGGKFGNGGNFDGVDDTVAISNFQFPISNQFSISQFLNIKTLATGKPIIGEWGSSQNNILVKLDDTNNDELKICIASSLTDNCTNYGVTTDSNLVINQWKNVQVIYDGTKTANADRLKLYVGGVERTLNFTGSIPSNIQLNSTAGISMAGNSTVYSSIYLDETRIYNRALSPDEIKRLYKYAPGPVAHWKMDEKVSGDAKTLNDISGYGNSGTTVDGANNTGMDCSQSGKYGSACNFDGVDDYIDMGTTDQLGMTGDMTISAWVYPTNLDNERRGIIVGRRHGYTLALSGGNGTSASLNYEGTNEAGVWVNNFFSEAVVDINKWSFVALSFRKDGLAELIVNGKVVATKTMTGGHTFDSVSGFLMGWDSASGWGNPPYFAGKIDDVRIYNYARNQEQILEDMSSGASGLNSPVLDLSFDEGQGSTAYDKSVSKNNVTLISGSSGANTTVSAMWEKNGKFGGALEFDGTDDYATATLGGLADTANNITISFWAKTTNTGSTSVIESYPLDDTNRINIHLTYGGTIYWDFGNIYGGGRLSVPFDSSWTNVMAHWVFVSESGIGHKIYRNGVLIASNSTSSIFTKETKVLWIGDFNNSTKWTGTLDELKIYSYALSEDEIKTLYNGGSAMTMGGGSASANNNGATVTGEAAKYCIPGDTAKCDKPIMKLKLDEKTGTTAFDSSGNGFNGTLANGPIWDRGKYGGGLNFDGTNDFVSAGQTVSGYPFTLSAWVKPNYNNVAGVPIFVGPTSNNDGCFIYFGNDGNIHISADGVIEVTTPYVANQWYHVAGVFESSTSRKLYVNGKLSGTGTADRTPSGWGNTWLGKQYNYGAPSYFNGIIDDAKIYNYARTPAQIAWDYNQGKPLVHYRFDEGEGLTAHNEIENSSHGTLTNMDATTDWVTGKNNKALDFDGVNDQVVSDGNIDLSGTDKVSTSFWFKFTDTSAAKIILEHSVNFNNNNAFMLDHSESGIPGSFNFADHSATSYNLIWTNNSYADGQWHYFVGTIDRSLGADQNKIYVDGALAETTLDPVSSHRRDIDGNFSSFPFYIGGRSGGSYSFPGQLDDVKIYNYALTVEQIKQDYNGGAVSFR